MKNNTRILYIEDNQNTANAVKALLELKGFSVDTANSVKNALNAIENATYDLAICDIGLPDGDGKELLKEIHRTQPVPAIALSGYSSEEDKRKSKEAGFSEYLVKPFDLNVLLELIDQLV